MGTLIVRHGRAPDDLRVDRNSSEPRTRPQCRPRPRPTLCPHPPPWKASHPGLNLIKYKISIYCRKYGNPVNFFFSFKSIHFSFELLYIMF